MSEVEFSSLPDGIVAWTPDMFHQPIFKNTLPFQPDAVEPLRVRKYKADRYMNGNPKNIVGGHQYFLQIPDMARSMTTTCVDVILVPKTPSPSQWSDIDVYSGQCSHSQLYKTILGTGTPPDAKNVYAYLVRDTLSHLRLYYALIQDDVWKPTTQEMQAIALRTKMSYYGLFSQPAEMIFPNEFPT